jgi:hypothetical protein
MKVLSHPVVLVGVGIIIGVVFASKIRTLPVASKLPAA